MITAKKRRWAGKAAGASGTCTVEALTPGYMAANARAVSLPPHRHIVKAAGTGGEKRGGLLEAICSSFFISLELRRTDKSRAAIAVSDVFFDIFSKNLMELGAPWVADEFIGFMTRTPKGDYAAFTRRLAKKKAVREAKASDFGRS